MLTSGNTVKDAKETIRHLQEKICDKALDVKEDLRQTAHNAGRKASTLCDTAAHETRDAAAIVKKQIRSNPIAASAIVAGAGFLLGSLFRRRR